MGDSIYFQEPGKSEELLNELQFNYRGKLMECLSRSQDSLILEYAEMKGSMDVKFSPLARFFQFHLEKGAFQNSIFKKLIALEFYLRPLALFHLKK